MTDRRRYHRQRYGSRRGRRWPGNRNRHLRLRGDLDRRQAGAASRRQRGKVLLIVNTASACGFTPQFAGLEKLWQDYRDQGLVVIGFPSNQFGAQDPGSNDEIASFCQINYGVSFPMMGKVEVNGDDAHPLWKWLTAEAPGILGTQDDQVELHQVPGRQGRQGDQALSRPTTRRKCDIEARATSKPARSALPRARRLGGPAPSRLAMFEHVEPFAGDPILSLNEDFQKDPRPQQDQPVDRHLLRRRRPHPGARFGAPRRAARSSRATRAKPYLPIEGAANFRAAVQALLFGAGHEALRCRPRRDDPVGGLERRPQGRRRLHRPLAAGQRGLGQRPELGEPPLDVRGRRPRGPRLSVLRRRDRRRWRSRRCATALRGLPREERRPARTPAATTRPAST